MNLNPILPLAKLLAAFVPFLLLVIGNQKLNLKKDIRSRQFLMPVVALVYVIALTILLKYVMNWCESLLNMVTEKMSLLGGLQNFVGSLVNDAVAGIKKNIMYSSIVTMNFLAFSVFMIIKKILLLVMKNTWKPGNPLYETTAAWVYEKDEKEEERWFLQESWVDARRILKVFYVTSVVLSVLLLLISVYLYDQQLLQVPFFPVLGIITIGELYFYMDGITRAEYQILAEGEETDASLALDYSLLRKILRTLFGDKVRDENTTKHSGVMGTGACEVLIEQYMKSNDRMTETYGKYMNKYRLEGQGHILDQNYLASGLDLLKGKSILFNNPFYYDLIPYLFYAMNHKLLAHKKVLIILGRHGIEGDIAAWCLEGLRRICNVEGLWRIGILSGEEKELDVGIVTRSDVQNLDVHKKNADFFESVGYVVLIEPSKLISTAQIGLNSLIRYCNAGENKGLTFCSTDKNCDGLVDALSHALMTSISEVSSTEVHEGASSYMCWAADGEHLVHRMLPNISRYLGMGTELSFTALKYDIHDTWWYGGEKFPVTDMHWIVKQYYDELLGYAELPASQELLDKVFLTSPNMWNAGKTERAYITAEDESNNVFEMKREFSTRTTEDNFVNIVSTPYLLCDYMTGNNGIFNADPKAIPYIVADYVLTKRNVLLRLCVQMAAGNVWESDVRKELLLAGVTVAEDAGLVDSFWEALCECRNSVVSKAEKKTLTVSDREKTYAFTKDVVCRRLRYNVAAGSEEIAYSISDEDFVRTVLGDLLNARYVAEEESENAYIGTECRGQIYQKYLPGQLFTLCGKYYEMLDVTYDGRVRLRRAADHITGRPAYRQVRNYTIENAVDDTAMGSHRDLGQMKMSRLYADISVATPAYWDMPAYNDFANARRVVINGIPDRTYNNKWILKIEFAEIPEKVRYTLTSMFNEVFRTLFAENQDMIVALTKGESSVPLTYGLDGKCDANAIYIVEDCQYDIGLLTAVERNINRIFQIVCDYLEWNKEAIEESIEKANREKRGFSLSREEQDAELEKLKAEKKGFFAKLLEMIRSLFQKKEKQPDAAKEDVPAEQPESEELPEEAAEEPVKNDETEEEEPDE